MDGHEAALVANMIEKRLTEVSGIVIMEIANWVMSDTAPAARAAAKHFPELDQEDCAMHMTNLCISYGLGVRDNTSTKTSYNLKTRSRQTITKTTTPSGDFEEGKEVIGQLRALNKYFSAGNRGSHLTRVQSALSRPELVSIVYPETRVAVCCKLLCCSIINNNVMAAFSRVIKLRTHFPVSPAMSDISRL
ncbi:hypothetical protein PC116_g16578 [Phytophthora cactorum]|uniref:Uncharacterized protein n=1 Tax=Phytophthora cactorum TaxID=29920 RepID=A0A8T1KF22_9STRA|nr:hypothetical protein PC117_g12100 [Phytophthora cactorum]KAG3025697.1 hypothetical protein PC119_g8082 [Phytophthora cactorum]KAG4235287.1 hypothetical protein PC116_g16578 [Phytophthora cactorum]